MGRRVKTAEDPQGPTLPLLQGTLPEAPPGHGEEHGFAQRNGVLMVGLWAPATTQWGKGIWNLQAFLLGWCPSCPLPGSDCLSWTRTE